MANEKEEAKSVVQSEDAEMKELTKIYKEAWDEGIFVREFSATMAAAGSVKKVEELEKQFGVEIDVTILKIGDCINLGTFPGSGKTRAESCRRAIAAYKKHYKMP